MKHITIIEHGRLIRSDGKDESDPPRCIWLPPVLYDRLKRFDQQRDEDERIFRWEDGQAKATQWVGVVQVPGLHVEILPKIDDSPLNGEAEEARYSLLYMLSVAGLVPIRSRDVAALTRQRASLLEAILRMFAERLQEELLRGLEHSYIAQEDNLHRFRGKLDIARHVRFNAAHRERFYCRFDEFISDTPMNRIFKRVCRLLLGVARSTATLSELRHCLALLDDVSDVQIQLADTQRVVFTRQNERFKVLMIFCQLFLGGYSPTIRAGKDHTFSLLFDMNVVFERFVARFLRRYVLSEPGFAALSLHIQAQGDARYLLREETGGGKRERIRLEPDLLLKQREPAACIVMDTKWKRLTATAGKLGGLSPGDVYQLYAYTRRYDAVCSVLLYPQSTDAEQLTFDFLEGDEGKPTKHLIIYQVKLHGLNRASNVQALAERLRTLIRDALWPEAMLSVASQDAS